MWVMGAGNVRMGGVYVWVSRGLWWLGEVCGVCGWEMCVCGWGMSGWGCVSGLGMYRWVRDVYVWGGMREWGEDVCG